MYRFCLKEPLSPVWFGVSWWVVRKILRANMLPVQCQQAAVCRHVSQPERLNGKVVRGKRPRPRRVGRALVDGRRFPLVVRHDVLTWLVVLQRARRCHAVHARGRGLVEARVQEEAERVDRRAGDEGLKFICTRLTTVRLSLVCRQRTHNKTPDEWPKPRQRTST